MATKNSRCLCGSGKKSKYCCHAVPAPVLSRTPPSDVRHALREEVGFGCPVEGCGNPYLEYHHFDPPWSQKHHHNLSGMIALCSRHHPLADAGTWTAAQLRDMKRQRSTDVGERLQWMRNEVLTVIGGTAYYQNPIAVQFQQQPVIWYNRDEKGRLLLNLRMLSRSGEPRLRIDNNDWVAHGKPIHLEVPPSGKRIAARYLNGDHLVLEFCEITLWEDLLARYSHIRKNFERTDLRSALPLTTCEITMNIAGSSLRFGPRATSLPNGNQFLGIIQGSPVGFQIG